LAPDAQEVITYLDRVVGVALMDYEHREKRLVTILFPMTVAGAAAAAWFPVGTANAASLVIWSAVILYLVSQQRLGVLTRSLPGLVWTGRLEDIIRWHRCRAAAVIAVAIACASRFLMLRWWNDVPPAGLFAVVAAAAFVGGAAYWLSRRNRSDSPAFPLKYRSLGVLLQAQSLRTSLTHGAITPGEAEEAIRGVMSRPKNGHLEAVLQCEGRLRSGALGAEPVPADERENVAPHQRNTQPLDTRSAERDARPGRLVHNLRWGVVRGTALGVGFATCVGLRIMMSSTQAAVERGFTVSEVLVSAFFVGFAPVMVAALLGPWSGGKVRNTLIGIVIALVGALFLFMTYSGPATRWPAGFWRVYLIVSVLLGGPAGAAYRDRTPE
jgi:hypothetical protein